VALRAVWMLSFVKSDPYALTSFGLIALEVLLRFIALVVQSVVIQLVVTVQQRI
jgi:hypothetical protein